MWGVYALNNHEFIIIIIFIIIILFYSINALQCQHWRSTATCAAALELPNLNCVHGELTLELKQITWNRKGPKQEKNPSNPRPWTAGNLMSSRGHTQLSTRRDGLFSWSLNYVMNSPLFNLPLTMQSTVTQITQFLYFKLSVLDNFQRKL